jgi:hypothetical protein
MPGWWPRPAMYACGMRRCASRSIWGDEAFVERMQKLADPQRTAARAQPGMWLLCFHDLSTYFAVLDETASTRRLGGTLLGRSHSPTSAFLHRHHSFCRASNKHRWKEPVNCDVAKRFLDAFRRWLPASPGNRGIAASRYANYALVCWPTHIGEPVRILSSAGTAQSLSFRRIPQVKRQSAWRAF